MRSGRCPEAGAKTLSNGKTRPWASLNWPNRISLLRLLLVAPFIMLVMNQNAWPSARYIALAMFIGLAISDLADGVLAKRMHRAPGWVRCWTRSPTRP